MKTGISFLDKLLTFNNSKSNNQNSNAMAKTLIPSKQITVRAIGDGMYQDGFGNLYPDNAVEFDGGGYKTVSEETIVARKHDKKKIEKEIEVLRAEFAPEQP